MSYFFTWNHACIYNYLCVGVYMVVQCTKMHAYLFVGVYVVKECVHVVSFSLVLYFRCKMLINSSHKFCCCYSKSFIKAQHMTYITARLYKCKIISSNEE